jgi:hypothetical protein
MGGTSIMKDRGPYTLTRNGIQFYLLDPRPDEVWLDDIMYSLSHTCRFNGHTHYNNAMHSMRVSEHCSSELALEGLLHDAAEAYTGDIVRPFQEAMGPEFKARYKEIESNIMAVIAIKFGFLHPMPLEVMTADNVVLRQELIEYRAGELPRMDPSLARYLFEEKFELLTRKRGL